MDSGGISSWYLGAKAASLCVFLGEGRDWEQLVSSFETTFWMLIQQYMVNVSGALLMTMVAVPKL